MMLETSATVHPWPRPEAPTEAALRRLLAEEGLAPYAWANGPNDVYAAHDHPYHKVIYVVSGSITFGLPTEARYLKLTAGDRLELPPGVLHDAVVGPQGVVCLEAQR